MNKQDLLRGIVDSVQRKHPHRISQDKYLKLFGELPRKFLDERLAFDNLLEKSKSFKFCSLLLTEVRIEIKLSLDELIVWELSLDKWAEAKTHNIVPNDIKKILKDREA